MPNYAVPRYDPWVIGKITGISQLIASSGLLGFALYIVEWRRSDFEKQAKALGVIPKMLLLAYMIEFFLAVCGIISGVLLYRASSSKKRLPEAMMDVYTVLAFICSGIIICFTRDASHISFGIIVVTLTFGVYIIVTKWVNKGGNFRRQGQPYPHPRGPVSTSSSESDDVLLQTSGTSASNQTPRISFTEVIMMND